MSVDGLLVRAYARPWLAPVLRAAFRRGAAAPRRWVFVHGCYGSGTTLLFDLLRSLPDVCGPRREGVVYSTVLPRPELHGWNRMWLECEAAMVPSGKDVEREAAQLRRDWSLFYDGSSTFVEKSISNTARIEWLSQAFPGCLHVNVVRDPWAVCEGMIRKARPSGKITARFPHGYPLEIAARQWARTVELQRQVEAREVNVPLVRYERLMNDPLAELREVAETCNVDLSGVIWDPSTGRLTSGSFNRRLRDKDAEARAKLDDKARETIGKIIAPFATGRYAYALPD